MLQSLEMTITILCCCMGMCCCMSSMCCAKRKKILPGLSPYRVGHNKH